VHCHWQRSLTRHTPLGDELVDRPGVVLSTQLPLLLPELQQPQPPRNRVDVSDGGRAHRKDRDCSRVNLCAPRIPHRAARETRGSRR
jgi:hypothetical protein